MTALSMRHPVLVQLRADRGQHLYERGAQGEIVNRYKAKLSNRGAAAAAVTFRIEGFLGPKYVNVFMLNLALDKIS